MKRSRKFFVPRVDLTRPQIREKIGKRMAQLRRETGKTQQECAEALGVEQPTYAEMEAGISRIRRRDLITLADLYRTDPAAAFPDYFPDRVST